MWHCPTGRVHITIPITIVLIMIIPRIRVPAPCSVSAPVAPYAPQELEKLGTLAGPSPSHLAWPAGPQVEAHRRGYGRETQWRAVEILIRNMVRIPNHATLKPTARMHGTEMIRSLAESRLWQAA